MTWIVSLFFACAAFLYSAQSVATAQRPDLIIIDGKVESLQTNPLEPYLEENEESLPTDQKSCTPSRASDDKDVQTIATTDSDGHVVEAVEIDSICISGFASNNWRGYVATWEVLDGKLLLRELEVSGSGIRPKAAVRKMFQGRKTVVASWYTGALIIPIGDMASYIHLGYATTYKKYFILTVKAGSVVRSRRLNEKEFIKFRDSQFEAYKKTEDYANKVREMKEAAKTLTDEEAEGYMFALETEYYLSQDFVKAK